MNAPLAVSPSNPQPGLSLVVDLLRGASSAATAGLRALIVAPRETGQGTITDDTEIVPVFSPEDVETAAGRGLGYFSMKALLANDPEAVVELICPTPSAGATAATTLTFSGTPTDGNSWTVWIQGVAIEISWNVGEADTVARDNAVAAINAKGFDLFAVASAGAGGVVDLDARTAGPAGNDIRLRVVKNAGSGGTLTAGAATLTGGTTEPDFTSALAAAAIKEYDYILVCLSNADAQSASASSNGARVATHIDAHLEGFDAKLQQSIYGSTGSIAAAKTNAIARNHPNLEHLNSVNDESLPCEIAAAELGNRMFRRRRESNANRVLEPLVRVRGSADPAADKPTGGEPADALNNGVSLITYADNGTPILMRSVTTHSQDTQGNPDRRAFDTNEVDALYDYAKDLRAVIPQEYHSPGSQVKVAKNREPEDEDLPRGVVETRDIKATIVARTLNVWSPRGVIDDVKFQAAVDAGQLIVEINESDPTQVDIFIPAEVFKIAAKFGLYIAKAA